MDYSCPTSVEEAIELLERYYGQARVIAGGTDVLPDIRAGEISSHCLVDITRIPGLDRIDVTQDVVEVGAAVSFAQIRKHSFLCQRVHALVDAARSVGAPGIQNAATWVGNVVQAMPAADGAIVALALDAEAQVVDFDDASWRPVESMFEGPGVSTVDSTRQIVTHIRFPRPGPRTGTAWRRLGRRPSLVLPILSCAVRLELDGDDRSPKVSDAAIALGPVGPRPSRARRAESYLITRQPTPETFARAAHIAREEADPRTSVMRASREYRLDIIPILVSDALAEAARLAQP